MARHVLAAVLMASVVAPRPAAACSCRRPSVHQALLDADVVAEVRLLEVGPAEPADDLGVQTLRVRIERVFKGPHSLTEGSLAEGAEVWVEYGRCNSSEWRRESVGERWILFFTRVRGRLHTHYCSMTLSALDPIPLPLIEQRERWLQSRR